MNGELLTGNDYDLVGEHLNPFVPSLEGSIVLVEDEDQAKARDFDQDPVLTTPTANIEVAG